MNTAELVDGLRNRSPLAAQCLHERYVPSVWRFVFFRVDRDTHLAEDIVSETVLALFAAAADGSSIENPGAWLRTVAQRRIQDHYRAAARVQHLVQQVQQQTPAVDTNDPASQHDQKLQRESVRQAMETLSESYREVLEWKYVDRLSVKAIAGQLQTSEKSVESILFRARRALKKQLQSAADVPPGSVSPPGAEREVSPDAERESPPVAEQEIPPGGDRCPHPESDSSLRCEVRRSVTGLGLSTAGPSKTTESPNPFGSARIGRQH